MRDETKNKNTPTGRTKSEVSLSEGMERKDQGGRVEPVEYREIENKLFERGIEVMIKPMQDNEVQIYPYPIAVDESYLLDEEVLDWMAGSVKGFESIIMETIDER